MFKKGDTLVEVALAVGIFSMVAIAVAAVLSGSTSGAQTALETTIAREEIDTQAEALRFVQTAYAISKNDTKDNKFYDLWKSITSRAIDLSKLSSDQQNEVLNYAPTSCDSLYTSSFATSGNMFVLNPRALGTFTTSNINSVYINSTATTSGQKILQRATINPRLIYKGSTSASNTTQQDAIIDDNANTNLFRAEGIYVIAVKDANSTKVVDVADGITSNESAFYDFYIRTCWYGTDADQPSTISTVIRLYDPDVLNGGGLVRAVFDSDPIAGDYGSKPPARKVVLPEVAPRLGWTFAWEDKVTHQTYEGGAVLTNDEDNTVKVYNLRAKWTHIPYTIEYNISYPDGRTGYKTTQTCYQDETCKINPVTLTASGYVFRNWCTVYSSANNGTCSGTSYAPDYTFPTGISFPTSAFSGANRTLKLYTNWGERNETITIKATWTSNTDYDTYISGKKSNGSSFQAYYGALAPSETVNGVTRILAQLDHDGRASYSSGNWYNETFTINTLGGRDYYYYIRNWTNPGTIGGDITITVSGPYLGTKTYRSTAKSSCEYWNVFAYKNGALVDRNTCSNGSPQTSY
ncbi:hypothetical protein IKF89_00620 [Candidatus Saccharibacteria bacterium]|nr:hypothetical protein [Candidatus Saccharibacteria bacterium]